MVIFVVMPFLVTASTLLIYSSVSGAAALTPARAFVTLTLFQLLQMPLGLLPMSLSYLAAVRAICLLRARTHYKHLVCSTTCSTQLSARSSADPSQPQ